MVCLVVFRGRIFFGLVDSIVKVGNFIEDFVVLVYNYKKYFLGC